MTSISKFLPRSVNLFFLKVNQSYEKFIEKSILLLKNLRFPAHLLRLQIKIIYFFTQKTTGYLLFLF